jgi:hypothetical protein
MGLFLPGRIGSTRTRLATIFYLIPAGAAPAHGRSP